MVTRGRVVQSFDQGTNGTALSAWYRAPMSGGGSGTSTFDNAHAHSGALSMKCVTSANAIWVGIAGWATAFTTVYGRCYIYLTANPSADFDFVNYESGSANTHAQLGVDTSGFIYCREGANGAKPGTKTHTGAVAIALNAWNRVDFKFVVATATTGEIHWRLNKTDPEALTASADEVQDFTAANLGTTVSTPDVQFGAQTSTQTLWIDDIEVNFSDYPGPCPSTAYWDNFVLSQATSAEAGVTAGSGTKKMAFGSGVPGSTGASFNKNSVAGPTAPIQWTDSTTVGTDGTAVSWYSEPLAPVTISGNTEAVITGLESATNKNIACCYRVERCDGTGAVISTVVTEAANQGGLEFTAAATDQGGTAAPTNTTLSNGDRLRFTIWADDAADQGGSGSMGSGGNAQIKLEGATTATFCKVSFSEIFQPATASVANPAKSLIVQQQAWMTSTW